MTENSKVLLIAIIFLILLSGTASATNIGDDILSQWVNASYFNGSGRYLTDINTSNVSEGSNLYYTDARARNAVSVVAPLTYNSSTGQLNMTQAGAAQNGFLSALDWNIFDAKEPAITSGLSTQYMRGDKTWQTLNTYAVPENGSLYYTETRFNQTLAKQNTSGLQEGSNLYFTNARARGAVSAGTNTTYNSSTGIFDSITNITAVRNSISAGTNLTYNALTGIFDYIVPSSSCPACETISNKSTNTALGTSDSLYPSQNAVKNYADTKAPTNSPTFTGTVTIPYGFNVGATTTTATGTEINNLNGTTSNIQTQLNGKQASGTYVTAVSGGTSPITSTGTTSITLGCTTATGSVSGCLSSTDWNTFNGKQAALGYTAENTANKNAANGYAGLDASSKLTPSQVNFFMTQSVVTSSRAVETVYHNTGTKPTIVIVSAYPNANGANIQFFSDASNPPTTQVAVSSSNANYNTILPIVVLPGNYYKLHSISGTWTLNAWIEWS